jgi:lipopolysaccharide/colanic/teichoic acid biosynthesis glycosyltransferase
MFILREGRMRRSHGEAVYAEPAVILYQNEPAAEAADSTGHLPPTGLPLESWRYRYAKRFLDIVSALIMLVVFLVPGTLIGLAILITSPYPVFYCEERIGRRGVPFRIWKFRSMRPHAIPHRLAGGHGEAVVLQWRMDKRRHDPRVTTIGRFLRRTSLDELPQIFNVLRGEMSLIGPRPIVKAETYHYKHLLPFYLAATPGLSGLWQVSGRSDLDYAERSRLDAQYVKNWSLTADLKIFLRTIPAVLLRVGAR